MKKKILLLIIFLVSIFFSINVHAYDKYDGDYTIEYLIRNYNVVTLGTKDRYPFSVINNTETTKGSVTNIFDIGGPVLIRGNYTGNTSRDNEYAQKTNGIPSYIKGKIGNSIKAGSIEISEVSNIYVGSSNSVSKSGDYYRVNNDTYRYKYQVKVSNDYLDFDKLYAAIVNEQMKIDKGSTLNNKAGVTQYFKFNTSAPNQLTITEPGYYELNDIGYINDITINNYDPNKLYVITSTEEVIHAMPILFINDLENDSPNTVYKDRLYKSAYSGNIIWNFPNARYIYTSYSHFGHIIAPKADIELVETHYPGCIIANSISSKSSDYTAIQFYPYTLDEGLHITNDKTKVTELKDINPNDMYNGNYSLDELLKNYSLVTLGQKDYDSNAYIKDYTNKRGSANIFHIGGQFLISGDLDVGTNRYGRIDIKNGGTYKYSDYGFQKYDPFVGGIKLDLRSTDTKYSSYLKGNLNQKAWDSFLNTYPENGYLKEMVIFGKVVIRENIFPNLYFGTTNSIDKRYYVGNINNYSTQLLTQKNLIYKRLRESIEPYGIVSPNNSQLITGHNSYNSDNYIDFKTLYDAIVEQQKNIPVGEVINPTISTLPSGRYRSCGHCSTFAKTTENFELEVGKIYTLQGIENNEPYTSGLDTHLTDIYIVFTNNSDDINNNLTIITILNDGIIYLPSIRFKSGKYDVNDYEGGYDSSYSTYKHNTDVSYGNIVWNLPNATYVGVPADNDGYMYGSIIAPNADIETVYLEPIGNNNQYVQKSINPTNINGTVIANSFYSTGKDRHWSEDVGNGSELHFYPLTVGSVGSGITKESIVIGDDKVDKINLSVSKVWNDNNNEDGMRPSKVAVKLLADGVEIDSKELSQSNNWQYQFTNLDRTKNNVKINYTVKEEAIENYSVKIDKIESNTCNGDCVGTLDGFVITNNYAPKKTSLTVNKVWDDEDNHDGLRPNEIFVQLYANGIAVGDKEEIKEEDNWQYIFENLNMYKDGEKINYTVVEDNIEGYTNEITGTQEEGYTITNTHEVEKITIKGTKIWDDKENQDGARPESVTINLLANGKKINSVTITEEDDWKFEFKELYDSELSKKIKYTITEDAIDEYSTNIVEIVTQVNPKVYEYNIINTYTPKKTSLTISKVWNDSDNKEKVRPKEVKVQLYRNGRKYLEPVILNKKNNWMYIFNELDMYSFQEKISYTVVEENVDNYVSEITGTQSEGYTITNTYILSEDNPTTGDNIMKYIVISVISIVSIIALIILILVYRKRRKV